MKCRAPRAPTLPSSDSQGHHDSSQTDLGVARERAVDGTPAALPGLPRGPWEVQHRLWDPEFADEETEVQSWPRSVPMAEPKPSPYTKHAFRSVNGPITAEGRVGPTACRRAPRVSRAQRVLQPRAHCCCPSGHRLPGTGWEGLAPPQLGQPSSLSQETEPGPGDWPVPTP